MISISRGPVTSLSFTTPSQLRKRKASASFEDKGKLATKAIKTAPPLDAPATPQTEPGSPVTKTMDSEEEYMSDGSSQEEEEDFEGTQDSEAGSIGEGEFT